MSSNEKKINWKLVEVRAGDLRKNPHNPKTKDEAGFQRLKKLTKKYGIIFHGVVNTDNTIIDGHSRSELVDPEEMVHVFKPDRLLTPSEYVEINALFDYAKAGHPDMFMIEKLVDEEWLEEKEDEKPKGGPGSEDDDAKFPLVPQYDEKHEAILILCSNEMDTTFIREVLGIGKEMSYKNEQVRETSVITAENFIAKWRSK